MLSLPQRHVKWPASGGLAPDPGGRFALMNWIDSHFHLFRRPAAPLPGSRYVPAYGASLDDWTARTRPLGVARGVLVQTSFLGTDNRELLQALRRHPERLRGVAVIDPWADLAPLAAMHALGVRGIRLNLFGASEQALAGVGLPGALVEALLALGWHVELHTAQGVLPAVLPRIDARLPVVLDHFGRPARAQADDPSLRAVLQRLAGGSAPVHVKLSASYRLQGLDPRTLAQLWRERLGLRQLLWGSDWPCTNHEAQADYARLLGALDGWLDDPAERRQVLLDNPQRLYWQA